MPVGRPYLYRGGKKKKEKEPTRIPQIVGDRPKEGGKKKKTATTSAQEAADKRAAARKKRGPVDKDKHGSMGEAAFADKKEKDGKAGPSLADTLTTIAASTKPGRTKIGAAISGALSGAAIGATIDEVRNAERKRGASGEAKRESEERKKKKKASGSNGGTK